MNKSKTHKSKTLGGTIEVPKEAVGINIYDEYEKLIASEKCEPMNKSKLREQINIDGIIGGIGSPYGEGAEYEYNQCGEYSHLDDTGKVNLRKDLETLLAQNRKAILEEVIQMIDSMPKMETDHCDQCRASRDGYNSALFNASSKIKEELQKLSLLEGKK